MKTDRKSQMSFASLAAALSAIVGIALLSNCHRSHPPPTPAQEERAFAADLSRSGSVPPPLKPNLEKSVTAQWELALELGRKNLAEHGCPHGLLSVGAISCFARGCLWQVRFKDQTAASAFEQDLLMGPTSPFRNWPGSVRRGPFLREPEGSIRTTWALLIDGKRINELAALHAEISAPSLNKNTISDLRRGDQ
jgi:hypothetical protein